MPPSYLIDEMLPPRAADGLATLGFDAVSVKRELGEGQKDDAVLIHARNRGSIFVTRDRGSRDDAIIWAIAKYDAVPVILVPDGIQSHELGEILCGRWRWIERTCGARDGRAAAYLVANPEKGTLRHRARPTTARLMKQRGKGSS